MKIFVFLCFALIQVSHQLPITRPDTFLSQFNAVKASTFAHRTESLTKISEYRSQLSQGLEQYYADALNLVDTNVRIVAEADLPLQQILGNEFQSSCITTLRQMLDTNIETAGYEVSNCVSNVDGVAVAAYKTAATALDAFDRTFSQEPTLLTNVWVGRNIFTEGKALVNKATNQFNGKVSTYEANLADVAKSLVDAASVFTAQIGQMDACFKARDDFVASEIIRIGKLLPTCQKFALG